MSPTGQGKRFTASAIRNQFPALQQRVGGVRPIYFDNPGGTQVPRRVLNAMRAYLVTANSNRHGSFQTSEATDRIIDEAHRAMADMLNAASPDETVFGPNMTTLTLHISRSIGRTLKAGDEIVVTRMDHDANISPWLLIAQDHDLTVKWLDFDVEIGTFELDNLECLLTDRTTLVACVYASNALGTINDIPAIVKMAHSVGAMTYVDAVQYAPHGTIDVQALDCDFLVCSAYKFFGPHMGILYGKREHLERLPAYKVRPASNNIPDRWETGTANHEGIAGVTAAVDYLAEIGKQFGAPYEDQIKGSQGRRRNLELAMLAIGDYERRLSQHLIEGLQSIDKVHVIGLTDSERLHERVPTVIFTVEGKTPLEVTTALGEKGIYLWDGNYYALAVMERLGLEEHGGAARVGPVHYNTRGEIDRFLTELSRITQAS